MVESSSSAVESSSVVESSSSVDAASSTGAESSSTGQESSSVLQTSSVVASSSAQVSSAADVSSSAASTDSSTADAMSSSVEAASSSAVESSSAAESSTASESSAPVIDVSSSAAEQSTGSQQSTGTEQSTADQQSSASPVSTGDQSTGEDASSTACGEGCFVPDPTEDVSHSDSSSSAEIGGAVGGVIGGLFLLVVGLLAFRYFRSSRMSVPSGGLYPWSSPSNAASSPSWSPSFNALKSSPSLSPGPNHEPGLALASFSLQDSPDMSPRSSGFLRESPKAGHVSAQDLHDVHHEHHGHPKFSFTLSEAGSDQPPSPFPMHTSYSPSQSNAPFLGAPISPIGPQSSNSWSPSQSCAQYQAMPPSPVGTSSQLQPPLSPVSPIVMSQQSAPKTEYFRMPKLPLQLPQKGMKFGFMNRSQPPSIPTFTTLTVTPPAAPKSIPPPIPVGLQTQTTRTVPPPLPSSSPKL